MNDFILYKLQVCVIGHGKCILTDLFPVLRVGRDSQIGFPLGCWKCYCVLVRINVYSWEVNFFKLLIFKISSISWEGCNVLLVSVVLSLI